MDQAMYLLQNVELLQMFGRAERVPPPLGLADSFSNIHPSEHATHCERRKTSATTKEAIPTVKKTNVKSNRNIVVNLTIRTKEEHSES